MSATVDATPPPRGMRISVRELTVQAGDRVLLDNASAEFPAGEVILLLGCSGVGKSVLLRIIAGLVGRDRGGVRYSGTIAFTDAAGVVRDETDNERPVAVVFQSFALLDELTPHQNVQIALDHARTRASQPSSEVEPHGIRARSVHDGLPGNRASQLLTELRVPTDRPTSVLSGGQQQRLAIARAIAPDGDVVLYDEPTSGLDTKTARQVADLIRETQMRHQRTSILVTHDHETLTRIADRIILLDHAQQKLVELPREQWSHLAEALGDPPASVSSMRRPTWQSRCNATAEQLLTGLGQFVEDLVMLPWSL